MAFSFAVTAGAVGIASPEKGEADEPWATGVVGASAGPVLQGRDTGALFPVGGAVARLKLPSSAGLMCPDIAGSEGARAGWVFRLVRIRLLPGSVLTPGSRKTASVCGVSVAMNFQWPVRTRDGIGLNNDGIGDMNDDHKGETSQVL